MFRHNGLSFAIGIGKLRGSHYPAMGREELQSPIRQDSAAQKTGVLTTAGSQKAYGLHPRPDLQIHRGIFRRISA